MKGTVVIIAMIPWHFTWQSQHNMASGFASRGYRVVFVEAMPKRWPRLDELRRVLGRLRGDSVAAGLLRQPVIPEVELVSPRMLPDAGPLTRAVNRGMFVPGISQTLQKKIQRPLIVINYLPTSASLALMADLEPEVAIYHCVNDWANDPYAPDHGFEAELAASVDMVWADSPINIARTRTMSDRVITLPHGVDIDLFAKARDVPKDVPDRPLCAYFGTVGISADIDLMRKVSHRYPLRLIGPVRVELEGFSPETELIGPVEHEQIPDLLRDVDVLLLPYAHTSHNQSVMPAKLFECLATGKPTIASGLGTLYDYADLFYIRENHEEFLEAIAEAVHESIERQGPRIACAEEHSYDRRMVKIERYVHQIMNEKGIEAPSMTPVPS